MPPLAVPFAVPFGMPLNDDTVTPGFLGFGVFLALLVATVFLIRSMNKRMRKIQAPSEAVLKQREWERAQQAREAKETGQAQERGQAGETEAAKGGPETS